MADHDDEQDDSRLLGVELGLAEELHNTCREQDLEKLQTLLENSGDANAKDKYDWSLLSWAARNGDLKVVRLLLQYGADKEYMCGQKEGEESAPIHKATERNHDDVVRELLGNDANVNLANKMGETALYLAIKKKHTDVVKVLLEWKAKRVLPAGGETPLHRAAADGNLELVKLLLEYDPLGRGINVADQLAAKDRFGEQALHRATRRGRVDCVQFLLQAGADPIALNNRQESPLHIAARAGNEEAMKLLVDTGCSTKDTNMDGWAAEHLAAHYGHGAIVNLLCPAKTTQSARKEEQQGVMTDTAIHQAAEMGHTDVVMKLVASGVSVDIPNKFGEEPLHCAAERGHVEVVKELLRLSATADKRSNFGYTPVMLAAKNGHHQCLTLLLGHARCAKDAQDDIQESALHKAAAGGHMECVEALCEAKAELNPRDLNQRTPLHHAAHQGHRPAAQVLAHAGAELMAVDSNGMNAYDIASHALKWDVMDMLDNLGASSAIEAAEKERIKKETEDPDGIAMFKRIHLDDFDPSEAMLT